MIGIICFVLGVILGAFTGFIVTAVIFADNGRRR